jgi:large subunit ribosomal protein L17
MRHLVDSRKLGRTTAHRLALFRNMLSSLILCDRIETTLPKAKELRRWADWMVTLGKEGTLASRRQAARFVQNNNALQKLFSNLADRFKARNGGYTRIMKLGNRHGDNAPMAIIEYLSAEIAPAATKGSKPKKPAAKRGKSAAA